MNHVGNLLKIHMQYWPSQVILTAIELDLFATLGDQYLTAEELSNEIDIDQDCSYDFFDTIVALGFLKRRGEGRIAKYYNFDNMVQLMDKDHALMLEGYKVWSNLKLMLKTGKSLNCTDKPSVTIEDVYSSVYYSDKNKCRDFHNAMDGLQGENLYKLSEVFDFSQYNTMLDLGSGSCLLSKIISKIYPELSITNFDLPIVLHDKYDETNIKYIKGDFTKDSLPNADVITMGNVLYNLNVDQRKVLMKKAYNALNSNGVLIVVEDVIDDLRRNSVKSLLMSLNMRIEFGEGRCCTAHEFRKWVHEVGFSDFKSIHLTGDVSALCAYK